MATVNFTEIDTAKLTEKIIETAEEYINSLLWPGDERRIWADCMSYILGAAVVAINEQCKARMLPYAKGYQLDALGERVNCKRLQPIPATVKLAFRLDTTRPNDIIIPAGTTVTADNKILFATAASATIKAGTLEVADVAATATTAGVITNGVPVGAIQSFVDKVPFVTGVVNTTVSTGGDDGEPYPVEIDEASGDDGTGDENYRERIRMAVAGFSCAGGAAAYEYFARSASANIEDVSVVSTQRAGQVDIYITEKGGVDPTEGTLEAVRAAVTDDYVKPLNDNVTVQAPEPVMYDIELTYQVTQDAESESVNAIEGEGGLIAQYNKWQQEKIGRNINEQKLQSLLLDACVYASIRSPKYTSVMDSQIARFSGNINISHVIVQE